MQIWLFYVVASTRLGNLTKKTPKPLIKFNRAIHRKNNDFIRDKFRNIYLLCKL